MFIEKIEITNFRSIQSAEVSFEEITAFLGRNGVGKSTVLYALESFYNVGAQYSELDYYNHQMMDATIRIRVTYSELRPDELAEFESYVRDGKLVITKVINAGGGRYFGTISQIPAFAELRALSANDKRRGLIAGIGANDFPNFGEVPRSSAEVDRAMEQYEALHPELTRPIDKETQFFGPKNVGGGKLDKFTKFVLVPAVRDANAEMEKRGAIMQLLDLIVMRSISTRRDFVDFKRQFEEEARRLYGQENLPELTELGRLITARLSRYAPGAELAIDFGELKPPTIPLPDTVVTLSEDNFKVPVRYSGHGLQRALILALLEQLSQTQPPSAVSAAGVIAATEPDGERVAIEPTRLPDLILTIEEPELYLHPARSRYLAKILRDLGRDRRNQAPPGVQVIYVTHSPYFVDVEYFDQVRACRKVPAAVGEPRVTKFTSFSRLQAAQRLAEITGRAATEFTARSFVTRAAPVLNSIVNEGLFADAVAVVEGDSDVAALWAMQAFMNQRWEEKGIVVVSAGGKNNIDRVVVVIQGFGIPTYFMFDGDRTKNDSATTNRTLLCLGGETPTDYPLTSVRPACAVFEENIESYLKSCAGQRYLALRDACATWCGHGEPSKALKNSEVMAMFLAEAHREQIAFPELQAIVSRISDMVAARQ